MRAHIGAILSWVWAHSTATGLAALAAGFSALSSLLIWRIQRANLIESIRPELILLRWFRLGPLRGDTDPTAVQFLRVRNAGRGIALHIRLRLSAETVEDRPLAHMGTMTLPMIEPGTSAEVEGNIHVWFKNAAPYTEDGDKLVHATVKVSCRDSRDNLYETDHDITVRLKGAFLEEVDHGLAMHRRPAIMTTARRMRHRAKRSHIATRLERVPKVGRAVSRMFAWFTDWL